VNTTSPGFPETNKYVENKKKKSGLKQPVVAMAT
jgi:hypothetical protein